MFSFSGSGILYKPQNGNNVMTGANCCKKTSFIKAVCLTVMTREKSIVTQKGIVINDKLLFAVKVPAVLIIYVPRLSLIRDKLLIKKQKSNGFKIACTMAKEE